MSVESWRLHERSDEMRRRQCSEHHEHVDGPVHARRDEEAQRLGGSRVQPEQGHDDQDERGQVEAGWATGVARDQADGAGDEEDGGEPAELVEGVSQHGRCGQVEFVCAPKDEGWAESVREWWLDRVGQMM